MGGNPRCDWIDFDDYELIKKLPGKREVVLCKTLLILNDGYDLNGKSARFVNLEKTVSGALVSLILLFLEINQKRGVENLDHFPSQRLGVTLGLA